MSLKKLIKNYQPEGDEHIFVVGDQKIKAVG